MKKVGKDQEGRDLFVGSIVTLGRGFNGEIISKLNEYEVYVKWQLIDGLPSGCTPEWEMEKLILIEQPKMKSTDQLVGDLTAIDEALPFLQTAWKEIFFKWNGSDDDINEVMTPHYPFNESFDEIKINEWIRSVRHMVGIKIALIDFNHANEGKYTAKFIPKGTSNAYEDGIDVYGGAEEMEDGDAIISVERVDGQNVYVKYTDNEFHLISERDEFVGFSLMGLQERIVECIDQCCGELPKSWEVTTVVFAKDEEEAIRLAKGLHDKHFVVKTKE